MDKPREREKTYRSASAPPPPLSSLLEILAYNDKPRESLQTYQMVTAPHPSSSSLESLANKDKPREQLQTHQAAATTTTAQPYSSSSEPLIDRSSLGGLLSNISVISTQENKSREQPQSHQAATTTTTQRTCIYPSKTVPNEAKDKLTKQLRAHQAASAELEQTLRQRLEGERRDLLQAIAEAVNGKWDRMVADAVARHRAQAAATVDKIVGDGKV